MKTKPTKPTQRMVLFRLSAEQKKALDAAAAKQGMFISELIRRCLAAKIKAFPKDS